MDKKLFGDVGMEVVNELRAVNNEFNDSALWDLSLGYRRSNYEEQQTIKNWMNEVKTKGIDAANISSQVARLLCRMIKSVPLDSIKKLKSVVFFSKAEIQNGGPDSLFVLQTACGLLQANCKDLLHQVVNSNGNIIVNRRKAERIVVELLSSVDELDY
ncbi:MAG: hypothetical protein LBF68_08550 [Christensenellaceae bacterium]|jgi:dGTP triphosphohydrolase|nr:hypothetical protein [Christensenellaceae bacterium]